MQERHYSPRRQPQDGVQTELGLVVEPEENRCCWQVSGEKATFYPHSLGDPLVVLRGHRQEDGGGQGDVQGAQSLREGGRDA